MSSVALAMDIIARDKASKTFDTVGGKADKTGKKLGGLGNAAKAGMAVAGAALVGFAASSFSAASDLEQSMGGVQSVFGSAAKTVEQFAASAAKNVGLAKSEYGSLAAVIGSQLQRAGQSQEESAKSTDKLITLGADLAATYGGSVSDAVSAVSSLLKGERDPIEKYAVGINEAAISAELAKKGLGGLKGAALDQAKAQATMTLLMEQTTAAQGAFGRESDTAAGRQERLRAQWENAQATLGRKLLPLVTTGAAKLSAFAGFVERNHKVIVPLVAVLGGLAAVVWGVNAAARAYAATQAALNFVLTANPIGLVVVAIAALVAGVILAYKHSETFRNIVKGAFDAIGSAGSAMWNNVLKPVFKIWLDTWFTIIGALVNGAASAFGWVPGIGGKLKDAAKKFNEFRDDVNKSLDGIKDKKIVVTAALEGYSAKQDLRVAHRYASGTSSAKPGMAWVGEQGPELVRFSGGQQVIPAAASRRMAAAGGGGGDNIIIYVTSLDPLAAGRAMEQGLMKLEQTRGTPIQIRTKAS